MEPVDQSAWDLKKKKKKKERKNLDYYNYTVCYGAKEDRAKLV